MNTFNWERFLKRWSQELLKSMGEERFKLPLEVLQSGWLGYPGASEEQIACTEARLAINWLVSLTVRTSSLAIQVRVYLAT
ncbi:MAG: hypothetical protein Fur006_49540 [Coleofasciculaceae cyanobacterium]